MSPPVPQINSFFQNESKPIIEPISKIFIVAGTILGINRAPLISSSNYLKTLILCYSTLYNLLFLFLFVWRYEELYNWRLFFIIDILQIIFSSILVFISLDKLRNFYLNLNIYDKDIGINTTKFGVRECVYNFLQLIVTLLHGTILCCMRDNVLFHFGSFLQVIPIKLMICFELHYYGHLFSLLIPRLKTFNGFVKNCYPNSKNINDSKAHPDFRPQKENRRTYSDVNKVMDLYNKIITLYDSLNDAVKWQMLLLLTTTFSITLCSTYNIVKSILWGEAATQKFLLVNISLLSIQLFPFLVPCVFADRVQNEVHLIKDFLASKLYENKLDKLSRRPTRSLLALIEARDLSFSLFHMFNIDVSLPFKFLALLLTYLVILLQFDKVNSTQ